MQDPRELHLKTSYHLLRYLKVDPSLGFFFSRNVDYTLRSYCDYDWASCPDSKKSVTGYVVLLGDSPISWKLKKQETISLSSVEAEYMSIIKVVGELVWLQRLFEELTVPFSSPIAEGLISLHHSRIDHQLADILTKALTGIKHSNFLSKLGVTTSPPT
ncbi:PREDICTED: uncharacterized protein LOC109235857 [Nicotiana attenuata]|uniref:uncharacterized protein LOC109235857 n=1 Tax=Nicotiana attenuata TaxID=49451 RepID=UPI000905CBF3|nr:PREDICTED: uncharacterized protein LOC109235857 [Nicotiana attenuata]